MRTMTKTEYAKHEDRVREYRDFSYNQMESFYMNGYNGVNDDVWESYCYVWRNSGFVFSSSAQSYEVKIIDG